MKKILVDAWYPKKYAKLIQEHIKQTLSKDFYLMYGIEQPAFPIRSGKGKHPNTHHPQNKKHHRK